MKRVIVLGSTGIVGQQALEVIKGSGERLKVVGLSARASYSLLLQQAKAFRPRYLYYQPGQDTGGLSSGGIEYLLPEEMVKEPDVDVVVVARAGLGALTPTLEAIRAGKEVVLANTEAMVAAGQVIMAEVRARGGQLHLVESEPAALMRCLLGEKSQPLSMVVTSSWGPYRAVALHRTPRIGGPEVLGYPVRRLNQKRAIDAATLMNKGFQVIQIHHLFGIPYERIHVIGHPQDVVRGVVQFADGGVKAVLGSPDPRFWIRHALLEGSDEGGLSIPPVALENLRELGFSPLNESQFPSFQVALEAGRRGGTFPAVLNAADEVAISLFLTNQIGFREVHKVIRAALERHQGVSDPSVEDIFGADAWAREFVSRQVPE